MNENNGKRFIWLFAGLFLVLLVFAGLNHASGRANNTSSVSLDKMIKAIVESDAVVSDIPDMLPDESMVPEDLIPYLRIEKERAATQKLVGDLFYVYVPSTGISSLYYYINSSTIPLYHSNEGIQFSDETFAPFLEKVEETYAQTL